MYVQKGILHVKALVAKTKNTGMIGKAGTEETCIIADGAAIGAEMNLLSNKIRGKIRTYIYIYRSLLNG